MNRDMTITRGRVVQLTFTIHDAEDDSVLDDTHTQSPARIRVGQGHLIASVEEELEGLRVGDTFDLTLPPARAYGERNNQMIQKMARADAPPDIKVGDTIHATVPGLEGLIDPLVFRVTRMDAERVVLDGNHPFAGKTVRFTGVIHDVFAPQTSLRD